MKRLSLVLAVFTIAALACALSSYSKVFDTTYKVKKDSLLSKTGCMVCHATKMGGKKLNAYGIDVQKVLKTSTKPALTAEMLHKLDGLDSDRDGMKNGDEIKAGRLPGVANK